MSKILFLDIDGPMIPGRAYMLDGTKKHPDEVLAGVVTIFDPVAVSLINHLCEERGWKLVIHSSWIRYAGGKKTLDHCVSQGINPTYFHEDPICDTKEYYRYSRVAKWLDKHPECEQYAILDDEPYAVDLRGFKHPKDLQNHLLLVDFDDGLLSKHFRKLRDGIWHRVLDQ